MITYTVADTGSTVLALLEGVDEGDDDPGTAVANSVAKSDGTAVRNMKCQPKPENPQAT